MVRGWKGDVTRSKKNQGLATRNQVRGAASRGITSMQGKIEKLKTHYRRNLNTRTNFLMAGDASVSRSTRGGGMKRYRACRPGRRDESGKRSQAREDVVWTLHIDP